MKGGLGDVQLECRLKDGFVILVSKAFKMGDPPSSRQKQGQSKVCTIHIIKWSFFVNEEWCSLSL